MNVTLDENGTPIADHDVAFFVRLHLGSRKDIHASNLLVIDVLRAALVQTPVNDRPQITWTFYGKEVHFDNNLRSHDAWNDPRTRVGEDALNAIIGAEPCKKP